MAEYVVISFPGKSTAEEVIAKLAESGEFSHNVEAAAIVSCDEEKCSLVRRSSAKVTKNVTIGSMAGGVTGILIANGIADPGLSPFLSMRGGGLKESIKGDLSELGIEEEFSREVDMALGPDSSAICFLFWDEPWDDLPETGKRIIKEADGMVLKTTLSVRDETELRAKLEKNHEQNGNEPDKV